MHIPCTIPCTMQAMPAGRGLPSPLCPPILSFLLLFVADGCPCGSTFSVQSGPDCPLHFMPQLASWLPAGCPGTLSLTSHYNNPGPSKGLPAAPPPCALFNLINHGSKCCMHASLPCRSCAQHALRRITVTASPWHQQQAQLPQLQTPLAAAAGPSAGASRARWSGRPPHDCQPESRHQLPAAAASGTTAALALLPEVLPLLRLLRLLTLGLTLALPAATAAGSLPAAAGRALRCEDPLPGMPARCAGGTGAAAPQHWGRGRG